MSREVMHLALGALKLISPHQICDVSHHCKKDYHGVNEPCPVQERFEGVITKLCDELAQPSVEQSADRLNAQRWREFVARYGKGRTTEEWSARFDNLTSTMMRSSHE
jgi:hypothetical protein